jgi:acetyltransferase-like isoleucine patch superfamily enzyme
MGSLRQFANFIIFSIASLRSFFWRQMTRHLGRDTFIREGCVINHPANVSIGDNCYIGRFCELDGFGGLMIGSGVHIASFSAIYSSNHRFDKPIPIREQGYEGAQVTIGDDVWVGSHVVILPGVTIASGAVIGAGSVVTHDVAANTIVAGVPATPVKSRFPNAIRDNRKKAPSRP